MVSSDCTADRSPEHLVAVPDRLAAWMRRTERAAADTSCADRVDAFIEWMDDARPDDLAAYSHQLAKAALTRKACDIRAANRKAAERRQRADRVDGKATGLALERAANPVATLTWATVFDAKMPVNDRNEQRRIGDMTAADHRFVAGAYVVSARVSMALSHFHRAIAKRLDVTPGATTSEVYPPALYVGQLRSIVGDRPEALAEAMASLNPAA